MTLLEVEQLGVRYGAALALQSVSFHVAPGEAVALLGPNGAGKTTLLRAVMGLVRPAAGRVLFDGRPLTAAPAHVRARLGIGYCPEGRRVFPGLTVRENLLVACWASARIRARRLEEAFTLFPALAERPATPAWQLSGGQQQMLALGRALMDGPRLLLLDEPSLGLSPRLADEVLGRVPGIAAAGTAVLLAESNAARALRVCARAVVLEHGLVGSAGTAAALAGSDEVRRNRAIVT